LKLISHEGTDFDRARIQRYLFSDKFSYRNLPGTVSVQSMPMFSHCRYRGDRHNAHLGTTPGEHHK
jgi:hypothetical protein